MKTKRILFIHHSTGGLLIRFGKLRELFYQQSKNVEFWDHGYNLYPFLATFGTAPWFSFHTGISDGNGKMLGRDFDINISNNSPREYADIFTRDPKDSTLSEILKFDVVMFKNCYPTSKIKTQEQLDEYKKYYTQIFSRIKQYPNIFIPFTQPPLRREVTNSTQAKNARALSEWMVKNTKGIKNIFVYNFFDALADNTNMLKRIYCNPLPWDSHPNIGANREVGKQFIDWLIPTLKAARIE